MWNEARKRNIPLAYISFPMANIRAYSAFHERPIGKKYRHVSEPCWAPAAEWHDDAKRSRLVLPNSQQPHFLAGIPTAHEWTRCRVHCGGYHWSGGPVLAALAWVSLGRTKAIPPISGSAVCYRECMAQSVRVEHKQEAQCCTSWDQTNYSQEGLLFQQDLGRLPVQPHPVTNRQC